MTEATWYETWFDSPYYHLLYDNRDLSEASGFIHRLIRHLAPANGSVMLDVACGKGRHSRALAEMGFDVTGIDLSTASIEAALPFQREHLHFFQHDMRLPFYINYFDYAFNFFTSFGYFNTRREHDDAMRTIAQSLRPGGTFVIDYLNVHYSEDHLVRKGEKDHDGVTFRMTRSQDESFFYKTIDVEDASTGFHQEFDERVAKFTMGDLTDMMAYQHLQVTEVFGDYQLGHYDVRRSPRMIMVAKKTERR